MRRRLLVAASSAALLMTSAAWAEQSTVEKTEMKKPQAAGEMKAPEATGSSQTDAETATSGSSAVASDTTAPLPGNEGDTRFGSYKDNPKAFSGAVAGGYSADDLIGKNLVDAKGDTVGEIDDLLVSANNTIDKAIVDVGGFMGVGEHRVALEIDKLQRSEDNAMIANMTKEELEALPEFKRTDSFWDEVTK